MRAIVSFGIVAVCCAFTCHVARAVEAPSVTSIVAMLSAYESMPSRDEWLSLGGSAVPILLGIANDPDELAFRRARALTAVGHFSDERGIAALADIAANENASGTVRRAAVLALAKQDFSRATPVIDRVLASADSRLRQVAVKALADSDRPDARRILVQHRSRERDPSVLEQVAGALAKP